jgi:hypothetical protein
LVFHIAHQKKSMRTSSFSILASVIVIACCSCSSAKNISTGYYSKNQKVLDNIEASYKELYGKKPFALQFTDKAFEAVSIDIITDSIKYVYAFGLNENSRMNDTLKKYQLNTDGIATLITQMKQIKCTWINNLDYYVDGVRHNMIFMSIRQLKWNPPFIPPQYYILTYFSTQQYFDNEGRLLDKRKVRRLRKINGDIFHRINDKVCYTVSNSFR